MNQLMIAVLFISLAPIYGLFLAPCVPGIAAIFELHPDMSHWIMTSFLIGYGLGMFVWQKNNQKAIYLGIALAFAGSLDCYYSTNLGEFCIGRVLQGLGTAAGMKVYFPMFREHQRKIALVLGFAVLPALGLAVSGHLVMAYGVASCSAFLTVFSVFITVLSFFFCESEKPEHKFRLSWKKELSDPFLLYHGLLASMGFTMLFLFATVVPRLAITQMALPPDLFGLWSIAPIVGLAIGLYVATHFSPHLPPRIAMVSGIVLSILSILVMGAFFTRDIVNPPVLFLTLLPLYCGTAIFTCSAATTAIVEASNKIGASNAMQILQIAISTLAVILIGTYTPFSPSTLAAIFGACTAVSLGIWLKLKAHH
jgi:MFS family permease